jgi:hypothetical protein
MIMSIAAAKQRERTGSPGSAKFGAKRPLITSIDTRGLAPQNTRLILRRGTQAANGGRL